MQSSKYNPTKKNNDYALQNSNLDQNNSQIQHQQQQTLQQPYSQLNNNTQNVQYIPVPMTQFVPVNYPQQMFPQQQFMSLQMQPLQNQAQVTNPYNQFFPNLINGQYQPCYNFMDQYKNPAQQMSQQDQNNNQQMQKSQAQFRTNQQVAKQIFQKQVNQGKHLEELKGKSGEQILNEFKAYTLPKLRLHRLIKLQAVMRGYYVRKFKYPKAKIDNKLVHNYVDNLVKHFIEDKIIPDLVVEILTYNKQNEDVSLYSTQYKAHLEIMDSVIAKVIRDFSRFIVRETTDNIVQNFVKKSIEQKPKEDNDPFALVVRDIIVNTIKQDCYDLAKSSVQDLTMDYVGEIHIRQLIKDKYITKSVKEVVIDSIEELIIESIVDDMIEKLSKELAYPLATHIYEIVQQEVEGKELDQALDNHVTRGILDIVLEQISILMDEKIVQKKQIDIQNKKNQDFMDQMKKVI